MAMLLGIFTLYGIQPGPQLVTERPQEVWAIVLGLAASTTVASTIGLFASFPLARLTTLKPFYISFFIFVTCMIGGYLLRGSFWDLTLALAGGVFGYWFSRTGYGLLPFALGLILAPLFEQSYFQAIQVGYESYAVFSESPLSLGLIALCVATVVLGPRLRRRLLGSVARAT